MTKNNHHLLRRTKIIATLGPASDSPEMLEKILIAGVNVVRLNFSHGSHEAHKARIDLVRSISEKIGRTIGILADLQGPKIRVANFKEGAVKLKEGDTFILDANLDSDAGDQRQVGIDYKDLPKDVYADDILLLDDGRIKLVVASVDGSAIICQVQVGGVLSNHKGINRKGGGLSAKALTEKDKADLKFALAQNVNYIAISFPRSAEDIMDARKLLGPYNGKVGIIAKIERAEAVEAIDAIINASDGVMVARGDLAVEIGDAEVPPVQKDIIKRARRLDKPVITATQMMESMIHSTVPTRAEASDVANAVMDNTDAVMLSAETAVGDNPDVVVAAMSEICLVAEQRRRFQVSKHRANIQFERIDEAIAMATMYTANHFDVKAVIALTESGATTLWMSRIRTGMPIYGLSRNKQTLGRMTLYRGVYPIEFDVTRCDYETVNRKVIATMEAHNVLQKDDVIILTKGDYQGVRGGTNAMKILKVGHVL